MRGLPPPAARLDRRVFQRSFWVSGMFFVKLLWAFSLQVLAFL